MVNHPEPQDVCTISLFAKFCDCYYIRWSDDYKTLEYAYKKGVDGFKVRNKIFDVVVLLQYLESNYIIGIFTADLLKDKQIYDRTKYEVSVGEWPNIQITEKSTLKIVPVHIGTLELGGTYNAKYFLKASFSHEKTGIGEQIERYANSTYHVTQTLKELVKNKFKTKEDIQYRKNYFQAWIGIIVAIVFGIFGSIKIDTIKRIFNFVMNLF